MRNFILPQTSLCARSPMSPQSSEATQHKGKKLGAAGPLPSWSTPTRLRTASPLGADGAANECSSRCSLHSTSQQGPAAKMTTTPNNSLTVGERNTTACVGQSDALLSCAALSVSCLVSGRGFMERRARAGAAERGRPIKASCPGFEQHSAHEFERG